MNQPYNLKIGLCVGWGFCANKKPQRNNAGCPTFVYSVLRILATEMGVLHSWDSWMVVVLIVSAPRGTPRTSGLDGKVTWTDQGHSLHSPHGD